MGNILITGHGHRNYGVEAIAMAMEIAHMARRDREVEALERATPAPEAKPNRRNDGTKIGRNEMCPYCKSGLKFKRCCGR